MQPQPPNATVTEPAMEQLITQATYARLAGVAKSTITRQVQRGIIPTHGPNHLVNAEQANAARRKNLDPGRGRRHRATDLKDPGQDTSGTSSTEHGGHKQRLDAGDFLQARTRREQAVAKLRELELREKRGELVQLKDVTRAWTGLVAAVRSRLLMMPANLATYVAAESNPAKCEDIMRSELYEALTELSQWRPPHDRLEQNP